MQREFVSDSIWIIAKLSYTYSWEIQLSWAHLENMHTHEFKNKNSKCIGYN